MENEKEISPAAATPEPAVVKSVDFAQKMKFHYPRTLLIGLAFFAISLYWQAYNYVVPLVLKYDHGLSDTVINIILMAENILAVFMLPLMGMLSDKTKTRFGKRIPYIVIGTFAAAMFFSLTAFADYKSSLALTLAFLLLSVFCMSAFRSPAVALMPDLTPKPLRSKGNAMINIMGVVGGIIGIGLTMFLIDSESVVDAHGVVDPKIVDYRGTSPWFWVIVGIIMAAAAVVLFFVIKENKVKAKVKAECEAAGYDEKAAEEKAKAAEEAGKSTSADISKHQKISLLLILGSVALWFMGYAAVTTAASRYAYEVWHTDKATIALMVAQGVAVIGAIPASLLAAKIGRKRTIMIGIVILTAGYGLLAIPFGFGAQMYLFFAMIGVGWIVINVNSYPMVVELAKGANVGRYTGFYYIASMVAQLATKFLSGVLLEYVGYWILFPYAVVFTALALVTMFFVRHGDTAGKKMTFGKKGKEGIL